MIPLNQSNFALLITVQRNP